ncbi:hypothetical protein SELMODRAFT_183593 [Selaginella moellendorffii]|uniref:Intimal thickness related receptor IRP domain-containing protein n=1 Tax=Selaginella moellendorffii TaxID=88036 RepID=D8SXQ4_SELML|nr:protein GPR107 [Selaginella moellendorffii]EFJ10843.1 hypothetical protein SELMODRAFT_183593 [Selaginella moellendorffii]|eukprot:XP_002988051.1 protein GPR107 [Selaginella moellendorffii]
MAAIPRVSILGLILALLLPLLAVAEIKRTKIKDDGRPLIMFEKFGFTNRGEVGIFVSEVHVSSEADLSLMGFFLSTEEALLQVFADVEKQPNQCILANPKIRALLRLNEVDGRGGTYNNTFPVADGNEYSLFFINCHAHSQVSMIVETSMYNLEGSVKDFLPAGQTQLPALFFTFALVYIALTALWIYFCAKHKETTHRIHILMGVLLALKVLNLLAEAEDKSYIKKTGTAHGWDVIFYISGFLKGVMLFTVIVLVGTGWSFLKPFLQDKEKKVLMVVIPLQVFANVASIVIDETGPATKSWFTWRQLFLLLDIICCCAILFPIVWSIKHLREASHSDGKAARNLVKLTLFRQYYIVVVTYIYFTRIVVFALTTITPYQYRWSSSFAAEAATLAFYLFTGYKFRPVVHNPYFVLDEEEEEAAQEALKDDDFDL